METIAVIGLGSMGKRRIRLLKNQLGKKVIGIDTNIERLTEVTEIFHIPCYSSIELAICCRRINVPTFTCNYNSYSVGQKNTCIFRN